MRPETTAGSDQLAASRTVALLAVRLSTKVTTDVLRSLLLSLTHCVVVVLVVVVVVVVVVLLRQYCFVFLDRKMGVGDGRWTMEAIFVDTTAWR